MIKRGNLTGEAVIHLILVGLIFALFIGVAASRVNSRGIQQQELEKEVALLIDSAEPGMVIKIFEIQQGGRVDNLELKEGKVFASVDGLAFSKGYDYFTRYEVSLIKEGGYFVIRVK